MAFLVPNEGESRLLTDLLAGGSLANWTLRLFTNNFTPAPTDVYASAPYTEVNSGTDPWYAAKTLTRSISGSTWQTVTSGSPTGSWNAQAAVAKSTYGSSAQQWTKNNSGTTTVYGYVITDNTNAKIICEELFSSSKALNNTDSLSMTPAFELGSGTGS